jgi:hypothetical protein
MKAQLYIFIPSTNEYSKTYLGLKSLQWNFVYAFLIILVTATYLIHHIIHGIIM